MHEASQRGLCRFAFVLLAALPVGLVSLLCILEYIPAYQRWRAKSCAQTLAATLGCNVEVAAVELRDPRHYLLHGVKLYHAETSTLMVRAKTVDVYQSHRGYAIRLVQPDLTTEQLPAVYRLIHDHVLCRPPQQQQAAVVWLDDLSIQDGTNGRTHFRDVRVELKRFTNEVQGKMTFAMADIAGLPASVEFTRRHLEPQPISHVKLDTGGQRLPSRWINEFAPQFRIAGADAKFSGRFTLDYASDQWLLRGSGELLNADASDWTERTVLTGTASVRAEDFSLCERGLNHAVGEISIHDGRIHDDLISAAKWIGFQPAISISKSQRLAHPFDKLQFSFFIDSLGIRLQPVFPRTQSQRIDLGLSSCNITSTQFN